MIKNYLKTGFRNLFRNKAYALINISGLAIGIASCLLISMFVKEELTYDSQHENGENIYRLTTVTKRQDKEAVLHASSYPAAEAYERQIPEIKNFTRLRRQGATVKVGDDLFDEKRMFFADKGLFEVFDFALVDGALDQNLSTLESIVLTERASIKYFGTTSSTGESLTLDVGKGFEEFLVTAVIENHPSNSSFNFDMVLSWEKFSTILDPWSMGVWFITPATSFIELAADADINAVVKKMKDVRWALNSDPDNEQAYARKSTNGLLPLKEVHWNSGKTGGDISQSYILSGIAVLILIIACFNFANLTIVNSVSRAKEVGVRKTIGARKKQLVFQFLSEAILLCCISFLMGVILAELALPIFESLTQKDFSRNLISDKGLILISFAGVLLASLLSVIYPAFVLSRFQVTKVFKGSVSLGGKQSLTKIMITFQFLIAMIFITVTAAMNRQHGHLVNKDIGYEDNNLIRLKIPNTDSEKISKRFMSELSVNPNIVSMGAASNLNEAITIKDKDGNNFFLISGFATPDYLKTLGVKLIEGRGLNEADRLIEEPAITNILINKTALRQLGSEYGVGSSIMDGKFRIVGIIDDYQLFSAYTDRKSVILRANPRAGNNFFINNLYVKYKPNVLPGILAQLESSWRTILPEVPFQYTFMDVYNEDLYEKEALWGKTLNYSSGLAIAVSIMGLLGLVGLTAVQKRKEVSIRKVLGASISKLVFLLNQGFTKLLLLAIILSIPIAYFIIDLFLQDYINRIQISLWLFVVPTLLAFCIVWFTVSSITVRSARRNPVDDLRYE